MVYDMHWLFRQVSTSLSSRAIGQDSTTLLTPCGRVKPAKGFGGEQCGTTYETSSFVLVHDVNSSFATLLRALWYNASC